MIRRVCQLLSLAFLVALVWVPVAAGLRDTFGVGGEHFAGLMGSDLEFRLYQWFTLALGKADPGRVATGFHGLYWTIYIYGWPITDPLAALGYVAATRSWHWPLLAGVVTPVLLGLVAGRFFCGWVCPFGLFSELGVALRAGLERFLRRRLPGWHPPQGLRMGLTVALLVMAAVSGVSLLPFVLPYVALGHALLAWTVGLGITVSVILVVGILLAELVGPSRLWCRHLCPTGGLLALLGRFRRLVGIRKAAACCQCLRCRSACTVGVQPDRLRWTEECILCGDCVRVCPDNVLSRGVIPVPPPGGSAMPARRTGWRTASWLGVVLLLVGVAVVWLPDARAHHMSGLPHYGYAESYPQVPTKEYRSRHGKWILSVTVYNFQGVNIDKAQAPDDVLLYFAVEDRSVDPDSGAYNGPVRLEVSRRGGEALASRRIEGPLEEAAYRVRERLTPGDYRLQLRFTAGGQEWRLSQRFRIEGGGAPTWAWLGGGLGGVVLIGGLLVAARRRTQPRGREGRRSGA